MPRLIKLIIITIVFHFSTVNLAFAEKVVPHTASGTFYPAAKRELSLLVDKLMAQVESPTFPGRVFVLVSPHAGYGYSGKIAASAYAQIRNKPYNLVVIIGPSHYFAFNKIAVYPEGYFSTPLGNLKIDERFAKALLESSPDIIAEPGAFQKEHSIEVQLPFLKKVLPDAMIVPVVMGDCTFVDCKLLAESLKKLIEGRDDVLVIVSTDMYHGYDYEEASRTDQATIEVIKQMQAEELYYGLREGKYQMCGGFGMVSALILAKELGHNKVKGVDYTNSAVVTGKKTKGNWTVGYFSCAINNKEDTFMLSPSDQKRLLDIARLAISEYLLKGKKVDLKEELSPLNVKTGAFVTLHEHGELRGCIGNLTSDKPLYLTVRDMAIEAAVGDPRFPKLTEQELKDVELEISVLSPLKKIDDVKEIEMGRDGVLIRKGFNSGVFLPQVATETGWDKEEFLSYLCQHKAGLAPDAWKDKQTDIYTFTAQVFSEK